MKTGTKVFWGAVAALAIYSIVKSNEPKKPIPPLDYTKTVYTADYAIICPLSLLSDPRADHDAMAVFDLLHLSMFNAQSKAEKLGCEVVRGGIEVTAVPMGGSDDYVVLDGVNFTADIYLTNSADGSWRSADSNTAPSSTDTSSSPGSVLVATTSIQPATPMIGQSSAPPAVQPISASTTLPEPQGEAVTGNVDAEVFSALENWAKANESNDPTLLANCYADQVDRYFLRLNVTNTFVHDYMDAWLKEHDSRVTMFKIKDVTFENATTTTVQLRIVKEVVTTNSKGAAERLTPSQLSLKKVAGEWKITSERDFK
jgi:hypothetical protein